MHRHDRATPDKPDVPSGSGSTLSPTTEQAKRIAQYVIDNPGTRRAQMARDLGYSQRHLQKYLSALKEGNYTTVRATVTLGLVRRGGYRYVIESIDSVVLGDPS